MKLWRAAFGSGLVLVVVTACSSAKKTYPTTFTCSALGGPGCPTNQTCPTVPLGSGGCEELPGLFGHPPTQVDSGRPLGCKVGLSYGNPYYGDDQQECTCQSVQKDAKPTWSCPV
jgi:hypothetical protein